MLGILKALDESLQKSLKSAQISEPDPVFNDTSNDKVEKREVYVRVVFIKLGEINTIQEHFQCDGFVQVKWREPKLDNKAKKNEEQDLSDWNKYWNPRVYIENCLGDPKENIWYLAVYDHQGKAFICQRRRIKGQFFERMELDSYPFDSQDLSVVVTTHRGENEIDLVADPSEISSINTQSFVDEQEWKLHRHMSSANKVTTNAYKSSKHKHPALSISCKASRRYNFFLWNIILIMVFIGLLLFCTFAVDVILVQNRLQLSLILLLTNITFKFNIAQTLPKVSYLTLLDKYVIIQMTTMCLVCIWHAVIFLIYDQNNQDKNLAVFVDRIAFGILLGGYVLFQLIFFFYATFLVRKKFKIFFQKEAQQKVMLSMMDLDSGKKGKRRQILPVDDTAVDPPVKEDTKKETV